MQLLNMSILTLAHSLEIRLILFHRHRLIVVWYGYFVMYKKLLVAGKSKRDAGELQIMTIQMKVVIAIDSHLETWQSTQ